MGEALRSEIRTQIIDAEKTLLARGSTSLADWFVRLENTLDLVGTAAREARDASSQLPAIL